MCKLMQSASRGALCAANDGLQCGGARGEEIN